MISAFLGRRTKPAEKVETTAEAETVPPMTVEEQTGNLSELEKDLNRRMVCPAGKNQVYLRSLVTKRGAAPPRIALRCTYRRELGQTPEVYFEHIRDVCACDPSQCQAFREIQKRLADL